MGYYTSYELDIIENYSENSDHSIIEECVRETNAYGYALENDGSTYNSVKWYDHEEEMKMFSKKYPSVVFKLYGDGEESEDTWVKYFKNGKLQVEVAKISFGEYAESKLK